MNAPKPKGQSYGLLIARYGQARFQAACAKAKLSPLSVEEILARDAREEAHAEAERAAAKVKELDATLTECACCR